VDRCQQGSWSLQLGRDDDHAGQAVLYYGSRGETPLQWGGALAERLGLVGAVDDAGYDAIYGPGGARDPSTCSTRTFADAIPPSAQR